MRSSASKNIKNTKRSNASKNTHVKNKKITSKKLPKPPKPKKTKKQVTKKKVKKKRVLKRVVLVCLLTNKSQKVNIKRAELLVKKLRFDSVDTLTNNFISRDACKMLRKGCSEAEIRQHYKNTINTKEVSFDIIKRYIKTFSSAEKMAQKRRRKIVKDVIECRETKGSSSGIVAVYQPIALDLNNPGDVQYLTQDSCWRPDIYLDNDSSCNECYLKEHCLCPLKKIKKTSNAKTTKRFK